MLNMFLKHSKRNNDIVDVNLRKNAKCSQKSINSSLNIDYRVSITYYCNAKVFPIIIQDYCKFISIK